MENVKRILPYVRRYVLMAIYDVLDEESISYHKEEDAIVARAKVYGNISVFSISAEEKEVGTELRSRCCSHAGDCLNREKNGRWPLCRIGSYSISKMSF